MKEMDTLASENIAKFISSGDGFRNLAGILRDYAIKNNKLGERIR